MTSRREKRVNRGETPRNSPLTLVAMAFARSTNGHGREELPRRLRCPHPRRAGRLPLSLRSRTTAKSGLGRRGPAAAPPGASLCCCVVAAAARRPLLAPLLPPMFLTRESAAILLLLFYSGPLSKKPIPKARGSRFMAQIWKLTPWSSRPPYHKFLGVRQGPPIGFWT